AWRAMASAVTRMVSKSVMSASPDADCAWARAGSASARARAPASAERAPVRRGWKMRGVRLAIAMKLREIIGEGLAGGGWSGGFAAPARTYARGRCNATFYRNANHSQ